MNRCYSRLGFTSLVLVAGAPNIMAQQTFGTFKGRVTDQATGAPKAGVTTTL